MTELSAREHAVLAAIVAYQEIEGRSPSIRELSIALGLKDKHGAARVVTRLRQRKLIGRSLSVPGACNDRFGGLQIISHHQSQARP